MQQLELLRLEASARGKVFDLLDNMMEDLLGKLAKDDITTFNKARLSGLIDRAAVTIEKYYDQIEAAQAKNLAGVAKVQATATAQQLESTYIGIELEASLPTKAFLEKLATDALIMGAPSEEWWQRQAMDVQFRFANTVRQGLVAGETTEQIVGRVAGRGTIPGIMDVTKANARSLVHTSIMEVANEARMATFKENDDIIEGVRQVSTLDSHTTDICMAYDGAEFDLDGNGINGTTLEYNGGCPRHWGCRSVEVPITKTFKELGINAPEPKGGTRASEDGQVPAKTTFGDFLAGMTEAEQNDLLGEGRADLWRDGKITLPQLLDQKGNPLTLEQLRKRYD